jgi:molybdopterin converting factor small subunit
MRVLLFARAREAAGGRAILRRDIPADDPSLAGLLGELRREFPALAPLLPRCRFAVNGTYLEGSPARLTLKPCDEVAILPPYSGG